MVSVNGLLTTVAPSNVLVTVVFDRLPKLRNVLDSDRLQVEVRGMSFGGAAADMEKDERLSPPGSLTIKFMIVLDVPMRAISSTTASVGLNAAF